MKRLLNALPVLILALLPVSAAAASPSPSPSPTLTPALPQVLVSPPAGYAVLATSGEKNGHFTAHDWASTYDVKAAEAERLLNEYGFVDGYNMTWFQGSPVRILNEFVLAFRGGAGATSWFGYDKKADASSQYFQHPDSITGIPQYFGLHETQSSVYSQGYLDGFVFVKGNDVIGVAYTSLADDNLSLAVSQAKSQYAAAPVSTIPPAQWPENANPTPSAAAGPAGPAGSVVNVLPYALFGAAALVAILLGLALLLARVRKAQSVAVAAPATSLSGNGPAPGAAVAPVALPLQMSADGNFWYDGEHWVDVTQEAPPFAPRSPDGAYWWDGYNWRPVAVAQAPASGR